MFILFSDYVWVSEAFCLGALVIGYLLGRLPRTRKAPRRWYKVPPAMRMPYDPENPLNSPVKRTDGW